MRLPRALAEMCEKISALTVCKNNKPTSTRTQVTILVIPCTHFKEGCRLHYHVANTDQGLQIGSGRLEATQRELVSANEWTQLEALPHLTSTPTTSCGTASVQCSSFSTTTFGLSHKRFCPSNHNSRSCADHFDFCHRSWRFLE